MLQLAEGFSPTFLLLRDPLSVTSADVGQDGILRPVVNPSLPGLITFNPAKTEAPLPCGAGTCLPTGFSGQAA